MWVLFLYMWMSSFNHSICWRGYHPYDICFFEYNLYLFFDNFIHAYNIFRPHPAPHRYLHHINLSTQLLFGFVLMTHWIPLVLSIDIRPYGSMVNWSGATPLKKTDFFLLQQPSTVNNSKALGGWDIMPLLLFQVGILTDDLYRQPQLLWVNMCNNHVMSIWYSFERDDRVICFWFIG